MGARVIVLTGPLKDQTFDLNGPISIGRGPDNALHLDDLQVSRRHAVIERTPRGVLLRDLGSGNGTYVGKRRVVENRLSDGDVIRIGQQQIRFETDEVVEASVLDKPAADDEMDSGVRFHQDEAGTLESANAEDMYQTFFATPSDAATQEQLQSSQKRLQAVYAANQIFATERDLNKLFARVMEQVFSLVPAHNGVILLRENRTAAEEVSAENLITQFVKSGVPNEEVRISSTIVRRAIENREAVLISDASDDARFDASPTIIQQNISSAMCVPLLFQKEVLGILYVDTRGTTNAFVNSDLELLVALAAPAAIAIKNGQYVQQLQQSYQDTLIVLANAIELRDHYTVGHTWRVTKFSMEIARELGWSAEKIREVEMGGVLHDVGKIAVDDAILRKPGPLTDEEYDMMKVHPERGADLLRDVERLHPLIPYCLYHHERIDGKGYPHGLSGEEIPLEGRLVAVADTFDALTSNRPYRKGFPAEKALSIIEECRGTQLDKDCADALISSYKKGRIDRILQDYYKKDEKSIACPFCSTHIHLPEGLQLGDVFNCHVCHRRSRLRTKNGVYYGELVPHSTSIHRHGATQPTHDT
jgi:HD-GYP domain-containing protein (c-di-GMP phosphodiesterase class II)